MFNSVSSGEFSLSTESVHSFHFVFVFFAVAVVPHDQYLSVYGRVSSGPLVHQC